MKRRDFIKLTSAGALGLPAAWSLLANEEKPNIIFIMADDLGKEWVSCYGAQGIKTPNIDKLAATGMQFSNIYCMPQCTPTRVCLLTGQYPFRNGWINHWDVPRWGVGYFDWEKNPSVARIMRSAGYKTGAAGKWQINDFRIQPDAMEKHGFDDYCMWTGFEAGNKPSKKRYWDPYIHTKEGSKTYKGKFGDTVFTNFLLDFFRKNSEHPLFFYYPMCLPHGPVTTTPLEPEAGEGLEKKKKRQAQFKAMVRYIDHLLGKIVKGLEDMGLRENTIIIWTTDNGTAGPFKGKIDGRQIKGGKGKTLEQGICVPFIVNCPGLVPQGKKSDALGDFTDLLPTFADFAGAQLPGEYKFDGTSLKDVFTGKALDSKREWIMAMGGKPGVLSDKGIENVYYYRNRVIRDKRYKVYIDANRKPEKLFDLIKDPGETENLISNSEHKDGLDKLLAVEKEFPEKDNDPQYRPLPKLYGWEKKPEVKAQIHKKGSPENPIIPKKRKRNQQ